MRIGVAILAAGKGERFGGDKTSAVLAGKPVWKWSYDTFRGHRAISSVGLVGPLERFPGSDADFIVSGGADRQESSRIGTEASDCDAVLIHDAARPFVDDATIDRVIAGVRMRGAAAACVRVVDTLRLGQDGQYSVLERSKVVAMQTPQGALRETLLRAHHLASERFTDEVALLESIGAPYELVEGDASNFKITTERDLERAQRMIGASFRTGFGYDIHRFSSDSSRPLMLGGVRFEGPGLEGHSDADVVIHAVVDALLGAAGLGDIGEHFPNTDPTWRGEPSLTFLAHAASLLASHGWKVANVDITVIAERPKVMPRSGEVRAFLSQTLGIKPDQVGFKATTNEGLGAIGRGEGIAAHAVATISR